FYHVYEINESGSEAQPAPAPEPDALFLVTAVDDQVRIRANSMVGDTIGMVSRGDVLHVLESRAEALPKIGKPDQWLHVLAPDGTEGYAAAWFFALYQPPEPQPDAPSTPVTTIPPVVTPLPPGPVFITPIDNRVRIRTRPIDGEPVSLVSRGDVLVALDSRLEAIQKIGVPNQWLHVRTPSGTEGYTAAWYFTIHDPVAPPADAMPEPPSLREPEPTSEGPAFVTPLEDRVRVRARAVDGEQIGLTSRGDVLKLLEPRLDALPKIGVKGQWLHVLTPDGTEGYAAAWFFNRFDGPLPKRRIETNMTGVNLDLFHQCGVPDPAWLGTMGWVRLVYNVSLDPDKPVGNPARYGNTDLEAAYQRYHPILQGYAQAGFKVLLVLTHQTFGEGAGYNWQAMDATRWWHLSERFAALAGQIAAQYRGTNIVQAYQIWNEMDAHSGARSSVSIPPDSYADLLARCIQAIRAGDPRALVITGGHASGVEIGVRYAREVLNALPTGIHPDGLAIHPYGRGTPQTDARFRPYGYIDHEINAYAALIPGWPVWITEWGILNRPDEAPEAVADYARKVIGRLKGLYSHKVAAAIWFAWAQGMDNGYGLVDQYHQARGTLTEEYVTL
ncbi:MAG: cellulase family glycosylhydrolase, partial [Anaerolineae bacterium]|nr:cellulase family glycosylhydrolase [Anaerolineae bacterium]